MLRTSIEDIRRRAAAVDEGRWAVLGGTIGATLASLAAVVWNLAVAPEPNRGFAVLLGVGTIILSWLFVHVLFATHYAHAHWRDAAGIEFPGCAEPDFGEFLYFAFTIGMTFQVSDATTTSGEIRRLVLVHGITAFLFNAVILAAAVNLSSSLVRQDRLGHGRGQGGSGGGARWALQVPQKVRATRSAGAGGCMNSAFATNGRVAASTSVWKGAKSSRATAASIAASIR